MALAMLLVPGMDTIAKYLATDLSPFQITFLRFALQSLLLTVILTATRGYHGLRIPIDALPSLALAGLFIGTAVSLLIWSLIYLPLANAIAIFFVEPLILTVFSALFLGEKVGIRRYTAVGVGLIGALIVIRPNWAAFGAVAILPLIAATFYAAQLTVIRRVSPRLGGARLQLYSGLFAALFLGIILFAGHQGEIARLDWRPLGQEMLIPLACLGLLSAVSHMMIISAFSQTQASILAPFQFLEIISATILGLVIFGDFPDSLTWVGTAVILSAGLYVFHRERRQH